MISESPQLIEFKSLIEKSQQLSSFNSDEFQLMMEVYVSSLSLLS